jgi:hypothetical protein
MQSDIMQVLEACPNARLVTNFVGLGRMGEEFDLPVRRVYFVNDGETFSAGDRTLAAIRPPYFDSPATRPLGRDHRRLLRSRCIWRSRT